MKTKGATSFVTVTLTQLNAALPSSAAVLVSRKFMEALNKPEPKARGKRAKVMAPKIEKPVLVATSESVDEAIEKLESMAAKVQMKIESW